MDLENRNQFLSALAKKLGRDLKTTPDAVPAWENDHPRTRLTDKTRQELVHEFYSYCGALGIKLSVCSEADVKDKTLALVNELGGGSVVLNDDQRLHDLGITELLKQNLEVHVWDKNLDRQNIDFAAAANVGIVYAEQALTESGGIVLEQNSNNGRSVSLLPKYSLVVFKSSQIVERLHQYAVKLDARAKAGERVPSVVNIISGPSSTADIELVKVVGVHGPVGVGYLIIDDEGFLAEHA